MDEIKFLEKYFGIKLPLYQKILLKLQLLKEPKIYIRCARGHNKWSREIARCMLEELGGEENE